MVDGDAAVALGELRHLLEPALVVAARAVQEDDGQAAPARVLVVHLDAVDGCESHTILTLKQMTVLLVVRVAQSC